MAVSNIEFSADEICRIIESGSKSGVSLLKLGAIEVSYLPPVETLRRESHFDTPPIDSVVADATEESTQVELSDPSLLEHIRMQQLLADDPFAFETEMVDSLLERERLEDAQQEYS